MYYIDILYILFQLKDGVIKINVIHKQKFFIIMIMVINKIFFIFIITLIYDNLLTYLVYFLDILN
jgi:hypothetical protein